MLYAIDIAIDPFAHFVFNFSAEPNSDYRLMPQL